MKRLLLLGILLMLIPAATALDLGNYPDQFFNDGNFEGLIVVGEDAPSQDVASAVELIPALQSQSEDRIRGSTLDSQVTDYEFESNDIISIGCNNEVTERITGMTCDDFTPTRGYIYLFESKYGKAHLVIAGGTPDDTEKAATLLGKHNEYNLSGNAYIVEMQDELIETELPEKPEGTVENETDEEIEEQIRKIKEQTKSDDDEESDEDNISEEQQKLQAKIDRLLEEPEVDNETPENAEKNGEQPSQVDDDAPLFKKLWNRFTNWLGWFFN